MEHEPPVEIADKPELTLCWQGLAISITKGYMTRRQAYALIERLEEAGNLADGELIEPLPELH